MTWLYMNIGKTITDLKLKGSNVISSVLNSKTIRK